MLESNLKRWRDPVDIRLKQLMTKLPGGGFFRPWLARAFICTHQHAATFLADIDLTIEINRVNDLGPGGGIHFCHFRHVLGKKIHMLHRQHW